MNFLAHKCCDLLPLSIPTSPEFWSLPLSTSTDCNISLSHLVSEIEMLGRKRVVKWAIQLFFVGSHSQSISAPADQIIIVSFIKLLLKQLRVCWNSAAALRRIQRSFNPCLNWFRLCLIQVKLDGMSKSTWWQCGWITLLTYHPTTGIQRMCHANMINPPCHKVDAKQRQFGRADCAIRWYVLHQGFLAIQALRLSRMLLIGKMHSAKRGLSVHECAKQKLPLCKWTVHSALVWQPCLFFLFCFFLFSSIIKGSDWNQSSPTRLATIPLFQASFASLSSPLSWLSLPLPSLCCLTSTFFGVRPSSSSSDSIVSFKSSGATEACKREVFFCSHMALANIRASSWIKSEASC